MEVATYIEGGITTKGSYITHIVMGILKLITVSYSICQKLLQIPFLFPKFSAPLSGTLREVLDNYTTTRDKIPIKSLEVTTFESVGVAIILKTGMKVA